MTCVHVCPYMAPRINEDNKAEVEGATCMGCGSCTAECPAKAITLRHFVDNQILAAVDGLLCSQCKVETPELAYPAQAGIAPPRWQLTSISPLQAPTEGWSGEGQEVRTAASEQTK
jgi:Fe-S-cluster-containing dehydrogenase component